MIFAGLSVGLLFTNRSMVISMWQLPATVLVALFSVVLIDFLFKPNVAKQVVHMMHEDWQQQIKSLNIEVTVALDSLSYLTTTLHNAKSQHSTDEYQRKNSQLYLYRTIMLKHNLIAKYYQIIQADKARELINQTYAAICLAIDSESKLKAAKQQCLLTEYLFYCQHITEQSAWLCLNECQLMLEDIHYLQENETHPDHLFETPNAPTTSKKPTFNQQAFNYGLRTVVAVAISLAMVFWLNLPGGVQTIIATIVTAGAPNIGASIQKMIMRALGIVIGSLVGFVVLLMLSSTQSILIYLVSNFVFIFFCARWSFISDVYNYAGIQAALLFIIMLSNTGMESVSLSLSTERLYGVFIGGTIAFIVVYLLVPARPRDVLNSNIKKVLTLFDAAWHKMQQPHCNAKILRNTFADIDQTIALCNQSLFEQRFLMTDLPAQQSELHQLQVINDLLKLINRLIISNHAQQSSIADTLKQFDIHFLRPSQPVSSQQLTEQHDRLHAKLQYCLEQIKSHWAAVKLPHVLIK